ncbi:10854_t:CDS:2 [Ambispora leptoticha]|uniref:10854_t:CDS:1 n=1 Tax=Ambispora leptoticha TaxID=144679 RepID=A0A9N8VA40_9GLOM|nr:10854_t:CDS:2 [Ambispora leptoticha]
MPDLIFDSLNFIALLSLSLLTLAILHHHQRHNTSSNVPHRRYSVSSVAKPPKNMTKHSSSSHRSSLSHGGGEGILAEGVNHTSRPSRKDSGISTTSFQSHKKVDSQGINKKHNKRMSNPVVSKSATLDANKNNQNILTFEEDYIS